MLTFNVIYRFRIRFKSFIEQYELRELHFHSLMRTKELEVQYHQSRYEREKKNADGESNKARHLQAQVQAFTKTETELRNQLNVYVDKFKQVRHPLMSSMVQVLVSAVISGCTDHSYL